MAADAVAHSEKVSALGLASGVVDSAFLRHVQGSKIEAAQPGEAVGLSAGFELVQAWDFAPADGHNHFAADFMRNVLFAPVGGHGADPLDRETRLERARRGAPRCCRCSDAAR